MKTPFFKLFVVALLITFTSCKKEVKLSEYKFAEKGIVLNCDKFDLKLLNEALFSFENDIINFYSKDEKNVSRAYGQFVRNAVNNRLNYKNVASQHTLEIFEVLKTKTNLWNLNNTVSKFNYNNPVFNCIKQNIQNKDLKTTLNALTTTNSMSPKLFGASLSKGFVYAEKDKYLAAYIAFDLFYAKFFDIEFSKK
ncbi:hypothetical protein GCM10022291_31150 [Postechiella marina]|uniref:Lipoprotein n=1 Tax=Postechiella marina TaxID=943941 RepID=A0ABP8CG59_9FLAO